MTDALDPETLDFAHRVFEMAREGDTAQLEDLLGGGLPANLTNSKGDTLLLLAAYHAHPGTVRLLLAAGADTNRVNDRGQTPVAAAAFRQNAEIVRDLLAAGADPLAGGPSALETAQFFGLPEMVALLSPQTGQASSTT